MAACEDQAQTLVGEVVVHGLGVVAGEELGLPLQRPLAPNPVDRSVPGRRDEPAGRVRRHALARPALERPLDGVPERVLGEVDVAEDADQGGEDTSVLLAEELRELLYAGTPSIAMIGRTSIVP